MNCCNGQGAGQQCQNCPALQTANSDGSESQARQVNLSRRLPLAWREELRYWAVVVPLTALAVTLLGLLASYVISRWPAIAP